MTTVKKAPNTSMLRNTIKNAIDLLEDNLPDEALKLLKNDYDYYLSLVRNYENTKYANDPDFKERKRTTAREYQRRKRKEKLESNEGETNAK